MDSPAARFPRLALAVAVILALFSPAARASDYYHGPGDYDDSTWQRGTLGDDDYATDVGPPSAGDTAYLAGIGTINVTGGSVAILRNGLDFNLSGAFSTNSYGDAGGTISGSGTLTAQDVGGSTIAATSIDGGNLVATSLEGSITMNGGTLTTNTFTGPRFVIGGGASATVKSAVTDFDASATGGSTISVPSIQGMMLDDTITITDAHSSLNVASDYANNAGFLNVKNGGALMVGGQLMLNGGKDVDGDDVGGGGGFDGAGTFVSVSDTFTIGVTAPTPGFSLGMTNGAVTSCNLAKIARDNGSYGIVGMSGTGTIWNVGQGLILGSAGEGELKMDTGAQLQLGAGSTLVVGAGAGSNGKLQADGTGTIIDARQASVGLGNETGSQGSVTLTDGASLLLGQDTFVGVFGGGGLFVESGSQVSVGMGAGTREVHFAVGDSGGGVGNVSVQDAGSQVYMGDSVLTIIGLDGNGFFGVGTGGTVRTSALELASDNAATGQIVLDGSGSTWTNTGNLDVGGVPGKSEGGTATITLTNGAQMRAGSIPHTGCYVAPTGQIVLDATSQFAAGSGAFGPGGTLRVTGVLHGKGKQVGTTVYNTNVTGNVIVGAGGRFLPGDDPDVFSIQGNCDLSDAGAGGGETDFEIGGAGTAGTDYDQLVVSGTTTLGGALRLVYLPGYKPKVGDAFTFVKAATVAGGFAQVVAPGLTVNPMPGPGGLTVTVTGVTPMSPPVVTSVLTATAATGEPFTYQIAATNTPGGYAATGLPDGLTLDPATGLVTGTPTTAGTSNVTLSATNTGGTGTAVLVLTVGDAAPPTPGAPVVSSAASAAGTVGVGVRLPDRGEQRADGFRGQRPACRVERRSGRRPDFRHAHGGGDVHGGPRGHERHRHGHRLVEPDDHRCHHGPAAGGDGRGGGRRVRRGGREGQGHLPAHR